MSERIDALPDPKPADVCAALARVGEQVVYFVQMGEQGPIKIGYSSSLARLRSRLSTLRTDSPFPIHLRRVAHGDRETERQAHRFFAHLRIRGEWFYPDAELASVAGGHPAPDVV